MMKRECKKRILRNSQLTFCSVVIFAGLFAVAFAAPKEASVGIEKAQFPWQWPMMGNGMGPWNSMPQYNNNNQYPIDYSKNSSNQKRSMLKIFL